MLHIIASAQLDQTLVGRIASGSAVLLQQSSVWAILPSHQDHICIQDLLDKSCQIYVLQEDLKVNGLADLLPVTGVQTIDYAGWVQLTVDNEVIQAWN